MGPGESAPTPPAPVAGSGLVLRTLPPESPQLSGSTSLTPALWLPENQKHSPLASGPGDLQSETEAAWGGGDRQKPGRRARGSLWALGSHPPLLIYLFSDGSWEGLAAGAVRKGWAGGGRGREGRRACRRRLRRAGRERAGRKLSWAPPALRAGDPPRLESPCSVRPGTPGFRGARQWRAGPTFARRGLRGAAGPGRCPGRGAEPASSISSKRVSSRLRCVLRAPGGRWAPHLGPRFCPMRDRVLRGFPAVAGGRPIPGRSLSGAPPACRGPELEGSGTAGGGIRAGSGSCALLFSPQETFPELAGRPHPASTLKSPHGPRVSPA